MLPAAALRADPGIALTAGRFGPGLLKAGLVAGQLTAPFSGTRQKERAQLQVRRAACAADGAAHACAAKVSNATPVETRPRRVSAAAHHGGHHGAQPLGCVHHALQCTACSSLRPPSPSFPTALVDKAVTNPWLRSFLDLECFILSGMTAKDTICAGEQLGLLGGLWMLHFLDLLSSCRA